MAIKGQAKQALPDTGQFDRDRHITARVGRLLITSLKPGDPEAAGRLERSLREGDPISSYEAWFRGYAIDSEDVSDVLAMYFAISWVQAQGYPYAREAMPSLAQFHGLRAQVGPAMVVDISTGRLPAHHVQEMADSLIFYTLAQLDVWEAATRSHQVLAAARACAEDFQAAFGMDLTMLDLTGSGFVTRSGQH